MKTKVHDDGILSLAYPDFLKEGRVGAGSFCAEASKSLVMVILDPPPPFAALFDEESQGPLASAMNNPSPQAIFKVVREGDFRTANGISGHERVFNTTNDIGDLYWSWVVVGKCSGRRILIQISVVEPYWQGGTIWESFLNSIAVSNKPQTDPARYERDEEDIRQGIHVAMAASKNRPPVGVLAKLPPELAYVLQAAQTCDFMIEQDPEADVEEPAVVVECIKAAMPGLTKREMKTRLRADMARLDKWLKQYRDEHPEELGGFVLRHGVHRRSPAVRRQLARVNRSTVA
jgi:hypothetical protein